MIINKKREEASIEQKIIISMITKCYMRYHVWGVSGIILMVVTYLQHQEPSCCDQSCNGFFFLQNCHVEYWFQFNQPFPLTQLQLWQQLVTMWQLFVKASCWGIFGQSLWMFLSTMAKNVSAHEPYVWASRKLNECGEGTPRTSRWARLNQQEYRNKLRTRLVADSCDGLHSLIQPLFGQVGPVDPRRLIYKRHDVNKDWRRQWTVIKEKTHWEEQIKEMV